MRKTFAVIGLDAFGVSVCEELSKLGADVLALDRKEEAIHKVAHIVAHAAIGDSTDESTLRDLGIHNIDHVIVSIGSNVQASILTTVILKELDVQKITVKVENDYHAKVVEKLGATEIISPEKSAGRRLARKILSDSIVDYYNISDEYGVYQLVVGNKFDGMRLIEMDVRNRYDVNVVLVKRGEEVMIPRATDELHKGDELMVVGRNDKIARFDQMLNSQK